MINNYYNYVRNLLTIIATFFVFGNAGAQSTDRTKAFGYAFTAEELSQYPQKTNVPTVYLEIYKTTVIDGKAQKMVEGETPELEDLSTIFGTKNDWYYNAQIIIRDDNGTIKERKEPTTVRGRGNATWDINGNGDGLKKKPLRLKFPNKTALLGENYATEKSWTLLANHLDPTLIRNAMTNELGHIVGLPFCPAYKFVDLIVNNQYMGTYQISDQVQIADKRVPVLDDKKGFFMEFNSNKREGFLEDPYLKVEVGNSWTKMYVNIKSPDPKSEYEVSATSNEIKNNPDNYTSQDPQYSELNTFLNYVSGLAYSAARYDRPENWRKYVDMETAVNAFIAMDITGNYDGPVANNYAYMQDINSKLCFGPLWDFDLAWGSYTEMKEKHFWEGQDYYMFGNICKKVYGDDPYFVKALYERWLELYGDGTAETSPLITNLQRKADELASLVSQSAGYNFKQKANEGAGESTSPDLGATYADYTTAVSAMKTFIKEHIEWLNTSYKQKYESLNCSTLQDIPESGLFFDGQGILWNNGEKVYTYTASENEVRKNAKLTITLSGSGSTRFFAYTTDTNSKWIQETTTTSYTKDKLTEEDVTMLKSHGYTFKIVVYDGECTNVTLAPPSPCDELGEAHQYTDCKYDLKDDGSYRRICTVCSTIEEHGAPYYKFTVYPESETPEELYATSWQPSNEHPNSIATVSITPGNETNITGWNIVNSQKLKGGNKICPDFRLTDGYPYYSDDTFVATKATYTRSISNTWGTLMLPFSFKADNETAKFYQLKSLTYEGSTHKMVLSPITEDITEYLPVFFKGADGVNCITVNATEVEVPKTTKKSLTMAAETVNEMTLKGLVNPLVIDDVKTGDWQSKEIYYISDNKFKHATKKVTINPFRAYIEGTSIAGAAPQFFLLTVIGDEATYIKHMDEDKFGNDNIYYTLDGRRLVGKPSINGLFIHNGRKEVVR